MAGDGTLAWRSALARRRGTFGAARHATTANLKPDASNGGLAMESSAGAPFGNGDNEVVFMPEDLQPEPSQPEPSPGGGSPVGIHAIRRKVLTGFDESGQPVDFGDATYALIDVGMRDGCTGLVCSTDGVIAVYTSHNENSVDMRNVSPEIAATARDFIDSLVRVAQGMLPNQPADWPMPRNARFWLRQNGIVTGITGSAEILSNNLLPWTRSFKLAERIIMAVGQPAHAGSPAMPPAPPAPPANVRAVALRRGFLLGMNLHGQPAAPGAGIAALVEFGIIGGCITVAVLHNGEISLIIYHLGEGLDVGLSPSAPEFAAAARQIVSGTAALSEQLRWDRGIDYPMQGEARIYRPTPQGILGTSFPTLAVHDVRLGAAGVFEAAMVLIKTSPRAHASISAQFPVPGEFYR